MIFLKLECQKRNEENDRIKIVNLGPVNITEIKTFKNKRAVIECGINALKSDNISQLRGEIVKERQQAQNGVRCAKAHINKWKLNT